MGIALNFEIRRKLSQAEVNLLIKNHKKVMTTGGFGLALLIIGITRENSYHA